MEPPTEPRTPVAPGEMPDVARTAATGPFAEDVPPLVAALACLAGLRGVSLSVPRLLAALPGQPVTPSPAICLRAAAEAGLRARLLPRPTLDDLLAPALPCVLLLRPDSAGRFRACVLTRLDADTAECVFPEQAPGVTHMPVAELRALYAGQAVFAVSGQAAGPGASAVAEGLASMHWFFGTLRHYLPVYRDVALASLVVNLLTLVGPLFVMNVYDRVVPNNALDTLWVLTVGLLLAHGMECLLRSLRQHAVDLAGRNADVVLADTLMRKVLRLRLDERPPTGVLVGGLREFEQVREFFASTTMLTLLDLPFVGIFIGVTAYIGGPVVLLPLAALPLMVGLGWLMQYPMRRSLERQYATGLRKQTLLIDIVSGLESIKAVLGQGRMRHAWESAVDEAAAEQAKSRGFASLASIGSLFGTYTVNAGVIVWSVYRISDGLMTQGAMIACVILVSRTLGPLMQLAAMLTGLQKARVALRGLDTIMHLPEEGPGAAEASGTPAADPATLAHTLTLRDVRFSYPGAAVPSLGGLSLHIGAGERVGIIGASGCGKSTLARLLAGLYTPREGCVCFGGLDIRQMEPDALRARVALLPQDAALFAGTVRDNIVLGCPLADDGRMLRAAALAGVTDFIQGHPAGFNLPVGERGMALSGGQRQMVALARTLARESDVLILDEPSSALDATGERRLVHRLSGVLGGRTLIVLTHRPGLLALVDRVVVLHAGRLLADGPRDAVLRALENGTLRPQPGGNKAGAHG